MKKHPLLRKWKQNQYGGKYKLQPVGYTDNRDKFIKDITKLDPDQVNLIGMFPAKRKGGRKRPFVLCKVSELSVDKYDIEIAELWKSKDAELGTPAAAIDLDKTTLNDLIDKYVDPDDGYLKNCKDQVNMIHHISFWREQLGKQLISWTDAKGKSYWPSKIREVANGIEKTRSVKTANNYMATLGSIFKYGSRDDVGLCEENFVKRVTKNQGDNKRTRKLDEEELAALMMECKKSSDLSKLGASLGSTDLYDMVMFSLMTACRFSECKKLRWEHVSFEDNKLTFVERKNGEDHHFSIKDPQLHKLLQDRFENNVGSPMVFTQPEVRGSFERACKRAGITGFRWHDLRHTSISYVLMSGGTLKEAQQHAGHKSYQSTLRYAHLDTTTTEKTSSMISNKIKGIN